jgi:hypothetical protein
MVKKKEMMKREREKKEALREGLDYENPVKNIVITTFVVTAVFVLFYFVTSLVVNKMDKYNYIASKEEVYIQYGEILAGSTFSMAEEEYYVMFYDFEGPYTVYYDSLISTSDYKVYAVDLGNGFNKSYVSESTNSKVNKAEELRVKDCTLIKIQKGKNVLYFEGEYEELKDKLK